MSYPSRCMGVGMAAALTEQVCGDIQDNVTAAGSTQGAATLVTGGAINALAANAAFSVAAAGQARLLGRNSLNWVTY